MPDHVAQTPPARANEERAMNLAVGGLANWHMLRILSVVDALTRECLTLEADISLGGGRVNWLLDQLIDEGALLHSVRSDNGPEFTSQPMLGRAEEGKINLAHIQPGRPMQNGHAGSFHGRPRDECLNADWFRILGDVRRILDARREDYNCGRSHGALAYRKPAEFSATFATNSRHISQSAGVGHSAGRAPTTRA